MYRVATTVLIAAIGAFGLYLSKRTPTKIEPGQLKREDFKALQDAAMQMLDRAGAELAACKEEHRRECAECNATIAELKARLDYRRKENHWLNNKLSIYVLMHGEVLPDLPRPAPPSGEPRTDENGDPL